MLQVQRVCPGNDPFLCVSFAYCYYMQTGAVCQERQSKSNSLAQQLGGHVACNIPESWRHRHVESCVVYICVSLLITQ